MGADRHGFSRFADGDFPLPPSIRTLGGEILEVAGGEATIAFVARDDFLNPAGSVQGGFLAAMLDDTIGPAVVSALAEGQFSTTIEMKVSFLRPAAPGRLIGHARVLHSGRSIVFAEASLASDDGQLIATASASLRIIALDETSA
jgi:uncharacterized protein (TIGR00369 family)